MEAEVEAMVVEYVGLRAPRTSRGRKCSVPRLQHVQTLQTGFQTRKSHS